MPGLGAPELLIVLTIVLLLFGGAKLPKLARSLGTAKREFEHGQLESGDEEQGNGSPETGSAAAQGRRRRS